MLVVDHKREIEVEELSWSCVAELFQVYICPVGGEDSRFALHIPSVVAQKLSTVFEM